MIEGLAPTAADYAATLESIASPILIGLAPIVFGVALAEIAFMAQSVAPAHEATADWVASVCGSPAVR